MRTLDVDQLKTLIVVIETGSLTAAAPIVALSQSAVSEQMRKLEERVGSTLLTRSKAGVAPTPAGMQLLTYARRMLALSDEAIRALQGETLHGTLRLAVTDYFRPGDLSSVLAGLAVAYPQVKLRVDVLKSDAVEQGYARGEFDIGLSMRIARPGRAAAGRAAAPLRREPLWWLGASGARVLRGHPVDLVLLPDGCALHRYTVDLLRRRRIEFSIAHVASGVAGLQAALAAGLGIACLNESALCAGVARLAGPHGLPAPSHVSFQLLSPRRRESDFVTRVRELLATQWTR